VAAESTGRIGGGAETSHKMSRETIEGSGAEFDELAQSNRKLSVARSAILRNAYLFSEGLEPRIGEKSVPFGAGYHVN